MAIYYGDASRKSSGGPCSGQAWPPLRPQGPQGETGPQGPTGAGVCLRAVRLGRSYLR